MRYLEDMTVFNCVAGTLGEPHKRLTSIPQGCPLSMTMVAFLMRPWIGVIKEIGATPRVLADDILVWDDSPQQETIVAKAYEATFMYINDIGGKAAPSKSYIFLTNRITRKRLRDHIWQEAGKQKIKVVTKGRDLGGQFCFSQNYTGAVLTGRMKGATGDMKKGRRNGHKFKLKAKIIRTAVLPKALYGCEAAPMCDNATASLRSAIAKAIAPSSTLASLTQIFNTSFSAPTSTQKSKFS